MIEQMGWAVGTAANSHKRTEDEDHHHGGRRDQDTFVELSQDLVAVCEGGLVTFINDSGLAMLDAVAAEEILGKDFSRFLQGDYLRGLGGDLGLLADETEAFPAKIRGLGGREADVELRVAKTEHSLLIVARDITNHLQSAVKILESEIRYRRMIHNALDLIFLCDEKGIHFVNEPGLKLLCATGVEDIHGRQVTEFLHEDYRPIFEDGAAALLENSEVVPVRVLCLDGRLRDMEMALIPLSDVKGGQYMVEARDITGHIQAVTALRHANEDLEKRVKERTKELTIEIAERRKAEEIVRYQASYDSLTGLPNRSLFFDRLHQELANAKREKQRVSLLFIDLDGFKLVNDTLGHDAGDLLLIESGQRFLSCARESDTVSRLGGDEFTIITPHQDEAENASHLAQRVLEVLDKTFKLEGNEAVVSGSIGIAVFPEDAVTAEDLIKCADAAMYRAKQQGKANYQFYTEMLNQQARDRETLQKALRTALDDNEFYLLYQPMVHLESGKIIGMEALLRWESATLGAVAPSRFIPVLEDDGQIAAVGEWALRTACGQRQAWAAQGVGGFRMALNISARQLRRVDFVNHLKTILADTGMEGSGLEIELKESIIQTDAAKTSALLEKIRKLGVRVTMDNFGTGSASMNTLRRLPIDSVKIDRSFVANLEEKEEDRQAARAIIGMAHGFGRSVVAEGVEGLKQLELLKGFGCHEAQGYLFSAPMAADEVETFAKNFRL